MSQIRTVLYMVCTVRMYYIQILSVNQRNEANNYPTILGLFPIKERGTKINSAVFLTVHTVV